jgi:voltage-gated potassium channel
MSLRTFLIEAFNRQETASFRKAHVTLGILSVLAAALAVTELMYPHGAYVWMQWFLTFVFTIEYALRIWAAESKPKYLFSFLGIVDLVSVLPSYLGLGYFNFLKLARFIRSLRMLRVLGLANLPRYFRRRKEK